MLVMAFAFAGHYMGQNAIAHNAEPGETLEPVVAPSSNIIAKGSLLPEGTSFEIINMTSASQQVVAELGKGDIPAPPPKAMAAAPEVQIVPASVDLKAEEPVKKKIALAPSKDKVEQAIKLKRSEKSAEKKSEKSKEKQKAIAQRRVQLAEENCLARAVYFEARSESELGQLAVAKVILNRVKDPEYPNTICGVVYQGSGRRNSCQFSFACDGLPDDVKKRYGLGQFQARRPEGHRWKRQGRSRRHGHQLSCGLREAEVGQEHEAAHQDRPSRLLRRLVTRLHG